MNRAYKKLTYLKSGVNIKKADGLIAKLQKSYKNNHPNVVSGIGGFASLYTINLKKSSFPLNIKKKNQILLLKIILKRKVLKRI